MFHLIDEVFSELSYFWSWAGSFHFSLTTWYMLCTIIMFSFFCCLCPRRCSYWRQGLLSSLLSFHSEKWLSCGRSNDIQILFLCWYRKSSVHSVTSTKCQVDHRYLDFWHSDLDGNWVAGIYNALPAVFWLSLLFGDFVFGYETLVEKSLFTHIIRKGSLSSPHSYQHCLSFHYCVINCKIVVCCELFAILNNGVGGKTFHESCKLPPTRPVKLSSLH